MKLRSIVLVAVGAALPLLVSACGGDAGAPAMGCKSLPVRTTPQPMACSGANILASEANNYSFSSRLRLPPVTVKSMTNLTIDWSAVTQDFVGHALIPTADLNTIALLMWQIPLAELETKLNDDDLPTSDLLVSPPPSWPAPGAASAGMTSSPVYDFTANGTVVSAATYNAYLDPDRFPSSAYSYMVAAATGTVLGRGFRMLQTFQLDPRASATTVALTNDSTKLTCDVSLRNLTVTGVPGGTPDLMLDFSQMTTNALGAEFKGGYVTSAIVGHYAETPAELEARFLDIETIAVATYRAKIEVGAVLDFTTLKDSSDAAFPGVDDTGTWLVGLVCDNCRNPAPWYMTVLRPCTPS